MNDRFNYAQQAQAGISTKRDIEAEIAAHDRDSLRLQQHQDCGPAYLQDARSLRARGQSQLGVGGMVATLRVGKEGFAAIGDPLHRPLQLACRPGHERFLGIDDLLAAEAAADIGGDHAQLALGNAENQHPDQHPRNVRKLGRGIERVVARRGVVLGQGRPRFHCVRH